MRIIMIAMAMLLSFAATARDTADTQLERTVAGEIEIAADGSVHGYTLDEELTPTLAEALGRSIRQWRFEPITVEGRPVIAVCRMRLDLLLVPVGENLGFRVADVNFGAPDYKGRVTPPRYPRSALRAGLGAKVLLVLKIDSDGNVEKVHAEQVSLDHRVRSDGRAENWRERFAEASIEAAREWSYEPAASIDGKPVGGSIRVPVVYTIGRGSDEGWQAYVPGPVHPAPWVEPEARDMAQIAQLQNGETQALDSRFRLTSPVVGSML